MDGPNQQAADAGAADANPAQPMTEQQQLAFDAEQKRLADVKKRRKE